ncbi:uncharacterized protein [Hoplias malabaricus]|uniref:uncharacterized protein n=1 Tax=Hoplias malabaricus TaxID=27720 RepID=UPI0034620768
MDIGLMGSGGISAHSMGDVQIDAEAYIVSLSLCCCKFLRCVRVISGLGSEESGLFLTLFVFVFPWSRTQPHPQRPPARRRRTLAGRLPLSLPPSLCLCGSVRGACGECAECVRRATAVLYTPYLWQPPDSSSFLASSSTGETPRTPAPRGKPATLGCLGQYGDGQQLMLSCWRSWACSRLSTHWRLRKAIDGALPCATKRLQSIVLKGLAVCQMAGDRARASVIAFSV